MGIRDTFKSVVDGSIVDLILPNNTTSIVNRAFYYCVNLESVVIPDSVLSISGSPFQGCSKLTTVSIGRNVNSITGGGFSNSTGELYVKTITFNQPAGMNITLDSGIFDCKTHSNLTIYTDNEIIKNYNYSNDNVSPTFYHLDGTAWT
jgi:hypothetical protein